MLRFTVVFVLFYITNAAIIKNTPHPLSDEFIDLINSEQSLWEAGRNFPEDTPMEYIKRLVSLLPEDQLSQVPVKVHDEKIKANLPENFDPREKWPQCPSLREIRDQGSCGSCWAFAGVESMTDRICIFSNGTQHIHVSAEDVVDCVSNGCHGGGLSDPWELWNKHGIVSGGNYNSNVGCLPYTSPPCDKVPSSKHREPCRYYDPTPPCKYKCRSGYNVSYEKDKSFGKSFYIVKHESDIMAELFLHGPVVTSLIVYDDFLHYKKKIYFHQKGVLKGLHAVKLMGWGVEEGIKYWLVANSWNEDWGDNGYFKILRGKGECAIAEVVVAAEPVLKPVF